MNTSTNIKVGASIALYIGLHGHQYTIYAGYHGYIRPDNYKCDEIYIDTLSAEHNGIPETDPLILELLRAKCYDEHWDLLANRLILQYKDSLTESQTQLRKKKTA